ncbi:MAG: beta-ketoacyl-[acyl-carrier-protein] synthase family protein [Deltaproteobacteria bacterium]|nr:beta-ketoacyl-[acyl-carrier-protein] synthase family protein [Deltaproteobacteria bacterium]
MQPRRVAVTGMGAVSPFGVGVTGYFSALKNGESGVRCIPELRDYNGLKSMVAARVSGVDPKTIHRKFRRTMSAMSVYATLASRDALTQAGLGETECAGGRMGVAIGSSVGSPLSTQKSYSEFFNYNSLEQMRSTGFFQIMNHSCAANVSHALDIRGRILACSAACSTSCQSIGYGYEMVAYGKQDIMLCGGAEEFHPLITATFDIMNAASVEFNDRPTQTPRPFDRDRDGVVCSEGSGVLVLESMDSAEARGVEILAEIVGFGTVSDTSNMVNPDSASMEACMAEALADAGMGPGEIDYINAHATGTPQGDTAECDAIYRLFGGETPVSSMKGHMGHTMAASGALEILAIIGMMESGVLIPTLNLDNVDDSCKKIRHVRGLEDRPVRCAIKNNFAFGGVNSSVVLRRYRND